MKCEISLLQTMYRQSLRYDIKNYYSNIIANVIYPRQLFPLAKALKVKNKIGLPHTIIGTTNNTVSDQLLIPNAFAEHFSKQHNLTKDVPSDHNNIVIQSNEILNALNIYIPLSNLVKADLESAIASDNANYNLPSHFRNLLTNADEL